MVIIRNSIFYFIMFIIISISYAYTDLLKLLKYEADPKTNNVRVTSAANRKFVPHADVMSVDILKSLSVEFLFRTDLNLTKPLQILLMRNLERDPGFQIIMYPTYVKVAIEIRQKKRAAYFHFHEKVNPYDEKWHKIVVKYCRGDVRLFYDCKHFRTENKIYKFMNFINASEVVIAFMTTNRGNDTKQIFNGFDVKYLNLYTGPERAYEENCRDLPQFKTKPGLPGPPGLIGPSCECEKEIY